MVTRTSLWACLCLLLVFSCSNSSATPTTWPARGPKSIVVAVAYSTPSTLPQWVDLVAFLNTMVGPAVGRTFYLLMTDISNAQPYPSAWDVLDANAADFYFTNAANAACVVREYGMRPIASIIGHAAGSPPLYGLAEGEFVLATPVVGKTTPSSATDIAGRVVVMSSPTVAAASLIAFFELENAGVNLFQDPAQVIITVFNNLGGYSLLTAGSADIWIVRADVRSFISIPDGQLAVLSSRTSPAYPLPASSAAYADYQVLAAADADPTVAQAFAQAFLNISYPNPLVLNQGISGYQVPQNLYPVQLVLDALPGLTDPATKKCSRGPDVYSAVTCPSGYYKKSRAAVASSCPDAGIFVCPSNAVSGPTTCICKPCRMVPPIDLEVFVMILPEGASQSLNTSMLNITSQPCAKLSVCAGGYQRGTVVIVLVDHFGPSDRVLLGLPAIIDAVFTLQNTIDTSIPSTNLTAAGGSVFLANGGYGSGALAPAAWVGTASLSLLGTLLLLVNTNLGQTPSWPVILQALAPKCNGLKVADSTGLCTCPLSALPLNPADCSVATSLGGIVGGSVGGAAVLAAACAVFLLWWITPVASWRIPLSELVLDANPQVVGEGGFGQIILARWRGTTVALKRARPITAARAMGRGSTSPRPPPSPNRADQGDTVGQDSAARSSLDGRVPTSSFSSSLDRSNSRLVLVADDSAESASAAAARALARAAQLIINGSTTERLVAAAAMKHLQMDVRNAQADVVAADTVSGRAGNDFGTVTLSLTPPWETAGASMSVLTQPQRLLRRRLQDAVGHSTTGAASVMGSLGSGSGSKMLSWWCGFGRASAFRREIEAVVNLRHPHIVNVMGAVVSRNLELLVMEYLPAGSLKDLLLSPVELEADVVANLLKGIVSGLQFLHAGTPCVLHNDIKAANVLIDEGLQAKVADFGLSKARSGIIGSPYHIAPEILNGGPPSKATDVYAFGMLIYEVCARAPPYVGESPLDVLLAVADTTLAKPKRPVMPPSAPALYQELFRRCTHPSPEVRPTFQAIALELDHGGDGLEGQMGTTLAKMERRNKEAKLLHSVFPARVAAALKEGRKVAPEHYTIATVFFCDVIGFTILSQRLKPEEVMDFLDRLYERFDALAAEHGVFKVETIGDAYMVVGGVPEPQPDHCARVAAFALDCVATAKTIAVKIGAPELGHLHIRAGFNCGPVVASVVGRTNPRFCLFGDTVNTASRMESNSERDRVHLSLAAAVCLRAQSSELADLLEPRGKREIKGKGIMETFWLGSSAISPRERRRSSYGPAITEASLELSPASPGDFVI